MELPVIFVPEGDSYIPDPDRGAFVLATAIAKDSATEIEDITGDLIRTEISSLYPHPKVSKLTQLQRFPITAYQGYIIEFATQK